MNIQSIPGDFTICKVPDFKDINLDMPFCFTAKTDEENSLICRTKDVPQNTLVKESGWRLFRIEGVLDFSLIGILARISHLLAEEKISLTAVSTYNTDYFLVKEDKEKAALDKLSQNGFTLEKREG